ncbi:5'-nucleotidase, lipoprotein e(P4) family [Acinetobacter sp. MD2]|uniref:5'-nucleotidase, lipoprotein e(P4) family n=1 Tax=Acinetobacter sp. MD2 TaxID=2600066 RepID=UPI002D1EA9D9|nr:5'-nucleotidase, lipoprotein e(P4) family [Acinetobacter sp. MD2]MEB3766426.1 5'-nucleotidase, lipoprotein e(P4) family [Acinetobacter sp. MD2]
MRNLVRSGIFWGLSCISILTYADTAQNLNCSAEQYNMSLKYQQSAEIEALQYQAYQLATYRLEAILKQHPHAKNLAIVTDLDETVLDNSALFARDVKNCQDFTQWHSWAEWERTGHPKLITGSLDFFNFASRHGVTIYYVSDRSEENRQATLNTLKHLGLPQVKSKQLLLYGTSKQQRREQVQQQHKIVMLLGDTLHDFSEDFEPKLSKTEKQKRIAAQRQHFGKNWIVLPNSSYGAWSEDPLNSTNVE